MKFTIADKEEAQELLKQHPSLSREDKDILSTKPVFSILKSLFEKYYNLELLHPNESNTRQLFTMFGEKPIAKYGPNYSEHFVSMVSGYDHLIEKPKVEEHPLPNEKPKKKKKIKKSSKEFLNEEEVQEVDCELHSRIEAYVNEHIANWTEMCECEEEGDALEFFLDHHLPSWRVRKDGTVDVIVAGDSRESFEFEWNDEEGEERTSNALDLLQGKVSHEFDDECNNDFVWSRDIEKKVIALFN